MMPWTVYNQAGQRKYLTRGECASFLQAAQGRDANVRGFCWLLAATGCRISEALALTERNIDFETGQVIIECLKKRGKKVFRAIPLPPALLALLKTALETETLPRERLWPWSRMTGYRRVREVMEAAGIVGGHASPKGLRHAFGVCAIQSNVPLNLVQRWLGHADMKTTAIYTSAMGPEEREFASRMWVYGTGQSPAAGGATPKAKRLIRAPGVLRVNSRPGKAGAGAAGNPVCNILPAPSEARDSGRPTSLLRLAILLNQQVTRRVKALAFAAC